MLFSSSVTCHCQYPRKRNYLAKENLPPDPNPDSAPSLPSPPPPPTVTQYPRGVSESWRASQEHTGGFVAQIYLPGEPGPGPRG